MTTNYTMPELNNVGQLIESFFPELNVIEYREKQNRKLLDFLSSINIRVYSICRNECGHIQHYNCVFTSNIRAPYSIERINNFITENDLPLELIHKEMCLNFRIKIKD